MLDVDAFPHRHDPGLRLCADRLIGGELELRLDDEVVSRMVLSVEPDAAPPGFVFLIVEELGLISVLEGRGFDLSPIGSPVQAPSVVSRLAPVLAAVPIVSIDYFPI